MFSLTDIYTSRGSNALYGCWTANVSKFDTSSFYNWEQDNLPLLDLEERTHLLWERLGNPTSAVAGFEMVVSGDATSSCNSKIFTSLSACLERIPEVINAPYFIEVASFGNLGSLVLSNKTFGPRGSIEIINRNFAKANTYSVGAYGKYTDLYPTTLTPYASYGLASAVGVASGLEAFYGAILYPSTYPTFHKDFSQASSLVLSSLVFSSTGGTMDARLANNLTVFAKKGNEYEYQRLSAGLAAANTATPWTGTNADGRVAFNVYEMAANANEKLSTFDASCVNEQTNTEIVWADAGQDGTLNVGNAIGYGNRLTSIQIIDCDGPIYIRNFTVDGEGYGGREYGIQIKNANDVLLENCTVARCTKAGLLVEDSSVAITRGFVAYRNYGYASSGSRNGVTWNEKIRGGLDTTPIGEGAGILAINSNINLSSTFDRDALITSSILSSISVALIASPSFAGQDWLFSLSRNNVGLYAVNSRIVGGQKEKTSFATDRRSAAYNLFTELNTEAGIKLENSHLEFDGRIITLGNYKGIDANNSTLYTDQLISRYNQKEATKLSNSTFKYNKTLTLPDNSFTGDSTYTVHTNSYIANGTHIKLDNSVYEPFYTSAMPSIYDRFITSGAFGVTQDLAGNYSQKPGIIVDNSSKIRIIHPGIATGDGVETLKAVNGIGISVTNNSEAILEGSSRFATKVIGPTTYNLQKRKSGVFAGNNSEVKIHGPTVIARFAVDAHADSSSKLTFEPHSNGNGRIDASGYSLVTPANHTMVELHSTRACLVATNNSEITMKDLGDYRNNWARGSYGTAALTSGLDYTTNGSEGNTQLYTSAGFMQFFPNPNDAAVLNAGYGVVNPTISLYSVNTFTNNGNWYYFFGSGVGDVSKQADFSGITNGGMCVRALGGSKVNVLNTHFPAGYWSPSSVIYEASGVGAAALCSKLFIWNIADNSLLDAKYISVSGLHPADAAYFGPSGVWNSTSSAPTGTPDTGSVALLDYYGKSTGHTYARSTAANQGPFRLYWSIDPATNWLVTTSATLDGYAPQVFAQGYNFSGNLSAPGTVSAFYTSLLQSNGTSLVASGFYYASAMVVSPRTVKAVLDDSAANTWANAKHNSVGKSGLAKVVSIYFPYTDVYGGDSATSNYKNYGKGVKSVNTFDIERDN